RAVVEDVTEMGIAGVAQHFDAAHAVTGVELQPHRVRSHGRPEARPAAARFEFGIRAEELVTATDAAVDAVVVTVVVHAREWALGALLARHRELLRGQLAAPFVVGLVDLLAHGAVSQCTKTYPVFRCLPRYAGAPVAGVPACGRGAHGFRRG